MRELHEILTERELYILEHYPAMTYKAIAAELDVSTERVRQLRMHAERMIREEKRRDLARERARQRVTITIQRREVWLLIRALEIYCVDILRRNKKCIEEDPDYAVAKALIAKLRSID